MQTYICKCGKTFQKSTKAETTGYELHDFSPKHECFGCPYIVTDRSWNTNEIVKHECRATPKITYLSKCHIGTGKGDFTACKVYSLDLTFVKRIMNYVNSLDGAEQGTRLNCIPGEWRAADFGQCYSSDNCFGLAIFNLYFKNNKAGTAARRLVKERFFTETGYRRDMTEEKERETVLMRIQIAKENARAKANGALFENSEQLMDEGWRYAFSDSSASLISKMVHGHKEEEDSMARKLQLDAAITKNMKAAASDSFIDSIKMIDIKEIIPSEKNFYEMSGIDLLADDIEREGLKHNLVVAKDPSTGLYEVKSGHRRLAAIELLIKEERINSSIKIPCIVDGDKTEAENEFDLIMLNATQRKYSDADVMHEYEQIERTLKALADEGKPVKGRMRDNIAKILKVSPAQVGKIENIKHNAVPEVENAVKGGSMSISTANELAKLPEEKQKEIIKEKPNISHAEVKEIQKQEKKPPVSKITEDDDLNELDELLNDDDLEEAREVKPEKKSSLVLSLILSENEAKTLLRFFYRFGGDYGAVGAADTAHLREIEAKLKTLCGK